MSDFSLFEGTAALRSCRSMPRRCRATVPSMACHVLNLHMMRMAVFDKPTDYETFERIIVEALQRPDALGLLAGLVHVKCVELE